ncbi:hypothetical protein NS274_06370 [Pseudomonas oryzihabitans]|nr:hypothetical protein NS274_06370 [Pseudomonas psychrotolerans]KTT63146.1 hypothetical protein NS383_21250 [Pseudomonas psychrotolerans]
MNFKGLGLLYRWLLTSLLLLAAPALLAAPGLEHQYAPPHYNTEALQLDVLDLQVQAVGGPVRMLRTWKGGQWVWNERWADLEVLGAADPSAPQGAADAINADRPYAVIRAGQTYLRANSTVSGQDVTFNNMPRRTLVALQRGLAGYRWQDAAGNSITYDAQGRMLSYSQRNGVTVSVERDAQGRIVTVKDHHGKALITLTYTGNQLSGLQDYSGRQVKYEYSGDRLSAVTDVRGQRWLYHYDGNGLAGYTDPLNQRTTYVLGKKDSVQEYRLPDGRSYTYTYGFDQNTELFYVRQADQSGLIEESWHDRLGQLVRRAVNGETQLTRSYLLSDRSSDVAKLAEAYRITGRSLAVTREMSERQGRAPSPYIAQMTEQDAHGNKTVTDYNRLGQITRIQYTDGSEQTRSYDPSSNLLTEVKDEVGSVTRYRYDSQGNLQQVTRAADSSDAQTLEYRYDAFGQIVQELRPSDAGSTGNRWTYAYDSQGSLASLQDPLGNETRYTYDVLGNPTQVTDALGHVWSSTFDAVGNRLTAKTPLGRETSHTYDALGQAISQTLPNGSTTTLELNAAGQPLSTTDALQAKRLFRYDAAQQLTEIVDALGNARQYQYDERGRRKADVDELGNQTLFQYDQERLSQVRYPNTTQDAYQYDARNRLTAQRQQFPSLEATLTRLEQWDYRRDGLAERQRDPAGNVQQRSYNLLQQLIAETDAAGGITRFAYDARGNLTQVTDPERRITQYGYDALDRRLSETQVGDSSTATATRRFAYDAVGNLTQETSPDGRTFRYQYDRDNRLIEARQAFQNSETTTQYSYDDLGLLASYEDETSRGAYTYDALGRLTATTVTYKSAPTAFSKTFSYRYDANGRVIGYTNPEAQAYDYRYTAHGQLGALSLPGEGTLSYQDYAWLTPRAVLFPGGSAWELTYDGLLRKVLRTLKDPAGRTLLDYRYSYDAAGNLVTLGSAQGDTRYQYDTRYQLTEARYPSGDGRTAEAYAYDGVGNRLDQQSTATELDPSRWRYNARNQLVSRNGIGYRYDQDGHLIEQGVLQADGTLVQGTASPHWAYGYDSRGRLAEVRKNATLVATYRYDPLGRRLSKTLADQGRTTFYLYNAQGLAAEYSASGELIQEYGYDPTAAWMSQPLFTRAKRKDTNAWTVSYFGTSHLGTPEVAFDKRGTLTWQASAQAFGSTRVSRSLIDNPLRFPGQYWDAETGLHYNYFRDYDPQTGRYVQGDPIGLAGGLNAYGYVRGNPLSASDPLGLCGPLTPLCILAVEAVGGSATTATVAASGNSLVTALGVSTAIGVGVWGAYNAEGGKASSRPTGMSSLETRQYDRHCRNADDPCAALKAKTNEAIIMARIKMNNMVNDPGGLFGTQGWVTHGDDLRGRLANIAAMISLGEKMGCDMTVEKAEFATLFVPAKPS